VYSLGPFEVCVEVEVNSIYRQFFPENGVAPADWAPFKKYEAMRKDFSETDFAVREGDWCERAKAIALLVLKIIILPWGLYEGLKALVGRIAMLVVYPAQYVFPDARINVMRSVIERRFHETRDFVMREVVLEKGGQKYTGVMLGDQANIGNGKWAIFAPGNCTTIEEQIARNINPYLDAGYNVLLVNGPGVGKSEGYATVERLGDAQEVGIAFLEEAVRAKRIVMAGHSLGGAAIGLAAMKHEFREDVNYLAMRMMTFDRLTHLVKKIQSNVAGKAIGWVGCEMDSVAASKKFQDLGIHEVVFQAENDEIMIPASLLDGLQREGLMENKTGIVIPGAYHSHLPGDEISDQIRRWDRSLAPAVAV
jgi:hypothetical protein